MLTDPGAAKPRLPISVIAEKLGLELRRIVLL